jgi:hypothetical protein
LGLHGAFSFQENIQGVETKGKRSDLSRIRKAAAEQRYEYSIIPL